MQLVSPGIVFYGDSNAPTFFNDPSLAERSHEDIVGVASGGRNMRYLTRSSSTSIRHPRRVGYGRRSRPCSVCSGDRRPRAQSILRHPSDLAQGPNKAALRRPIIDSPKSRSFSDPTALVAPVLALSTAAHTCPAD